MLLECVDLPTALQVRSCTWLSFETDRAESHAVQGERMSGLNSVLANCKFLPHFLSSLVLLLFMHVPDSVDTFHGICPLLNLLNN